MKTESRFEEEGLSLCEKSGPLAPLGEREERRAD